ncbi:hypothetical protein BY996DRAFT_6421518 [Phakopsora pachyrhizi]|nr:hypothetical protein BY996DRAFT_6421518 [Phakopsora pachyrhizi]
MTGAFGEEMISLMRKAELVEDGRFNLCANEPLAGLMPKLVIERVSKNKVATTQSDSDLDSISSTESDDSGDEEPEKLEEQSSKAIEVMNQSNSDSSTESEPSSDDDESDGTAVQSVYSTIFGNKIDEATTGSKRNCSSPEADSRCSSHENRPTKIRKKFKRKSILSSSKDSSKESKKTLSSSDLSSSIAAKLKITKCGKGKSSSSELSQPEDKKLESKAKAASYTAEHLSNISSNIPVSSLSSCKIVEIKKPILPLGGCRQRKLKLTLGLKTTVS